MAVKSLPFNVVDVEMDDIEDLEDSLPDIIKLRNVVAQTDVSTITGGRSIQFFIKLYQPITLFVEKGNLFLPLTE